MTRRKIWATHKADNQGLLAHRRKVERLFFKFGYHTRFQGVRAKPKFHTGRVIILNSFSEADGLSILMLFEIVGRGNY
jgi:hypothetical protein